MKTSIYEPRILFLTSHCKIAVFSLVNRTYAKFGSKRKEDFTAPGKQGVIKFFYASVLAAGILLFIANHCAAQVQPDIQQAILNEKNEGTTEVSTAELRQILAEGAVAIFDTRPFHEFAISHIPGARNVAAKPGIPMSEYVSDVAEIGRAVGGDKKAPMILYCNGPYCGKSKRLAVELLSAGYTNLRRYQLGIPVWRALGGICQIEAEGLRYVLEQDRTVVVIDIRESERFRAGTLPGARNIPRSLVLEGKDVGDIKRAKDDGRLPMEDHNTRLIVVGDDTTAVRYVAQAIAHEAFCNVTFFSGSVAEASALIRK
jgi:rhodanese-related sulfurtransferase